MCKKPIQLHKRSTEAAFTQIPNNVQATNPNSFVDTFAKHQYLQMSPSNCLYVSSLNGYLPRQKSSNSRKIQVDSFPDHTQ